MSLKIVSPESLGQVLRAERQKKGLTQKLVGNSVGIEQHTISKIEKGNPGAELGTLFRVLAALDLELVVQQRLRPLDEGKGDTW